MSPLVGYRSGSTVRAAFLVFLATEGSCRLGAAGEEARPIAGFDMVTVGTAAILLRDAALRESVVARDERATVEPGQARSQRTQP